MGTFLTYTATQDGILSPILLLLAEQQPVGR